MYCSWCPKNGGDCSVCGGGPVIDDDPPPSDKWWVLATVLLHLPIIVLVMWFVLSRR